MPIIDDLLRKYPIISDQVSEADLRVILEELHTVLDTGVPGSIVEFGCYIGTTSLFIQRLLGMRHEDRAFHVYDSFEGLPEKRTQDESPAGIGFRAGALTVSKKQFIREFQKAHVPLPRIHKGWFDQVSEADIPSQIAFAFLDGDFYASIKASLRLVIPRVSAGGTIVVDDYVREALPGVARALQESNLPVQARYGLGIIHVR